MKWNGRAALERHGVAWLGMASNGRRGTSGRGLAWTGGVRQERMGTVGRGLAGRGMARSGGNRRGMAGMDPQSCRGGPEAIATVRTWMEPCVCSHPRVEHELVTRGKRAGLRVECLTTEGTTKCGCKIYSPVPDQPRHDDASPA